MKKIKYILFFAIALLNFSCEMEKTFDTSLDESVITANVTNSVGFANQCYGGFMVNGLNRLAGSFQDCATDNAISSNPNSQIHFYNNGALTASNHPESGLWDQYYQGIRHCNLFFEYYPKLRIDTVASTTNKRSNEYENSNMKRRMYYEAKALRAIYHFELMYRFGGIPIVTKVLDLNNPDKEALKRQSIDSCVLFVKKELAECMEVLPIRYIQNGNLGRISQTACMAVISRMMLYYASPLYNPQGIEQRWRDAAAASKELITLAETLPASNTEGIGLAMGLPTAYSDLFTGNVFTGFNGRENIWGSPYVNRGMGISFFPTDLAGGSSTINPTQDLIDSYRMSNGRSIYDLDSPIKYNPENPYSNRENRFSQTIVFNTKSWNTGALANKIEYFYSKTDPAIRGINVPLNRSTITRTGYSMQKWIQPTTSNANNQLTGYMYYRYAEILLNYIEALNEYDPTHPDVSKYFTAIRQRHGGLTAANADFPVSERYADSGVVTIRGNKEEQRKWIHNERRIDFAFEDHRYFDIRRWKLFGDETKTYPVHGMKIYIKNYELKPEKMVLTNFEYEPFVVETRTWNPKMYWMPIPLKDLLGVGAEALPQNPGWE